MSGHTWWPDNDKSWRLWHSPTYEERRNVLDLNSYGSKGWEKPWTKAWDWGSPTGALPRKKLFESPDKTSGRSSKDNLPVMEIPDEFDSDAKFLDRNKRFGKDFPRYVSTSAWSLKNNLQNRDVTGITLAEMCYLGLHNISLRYLAHGYPTSVVLTRGVKGVHSRRKADEGSQRSWCRYRHAEQDGSRARIWPVSGHLKSGVED